MVARQLVNRVQKRSFSFVSDSRQLFKTNPEPTYIKRSSDKPLFMGLVGLYVFGMAQWARGSWNMVNGINKK